MTYLNIFNKTEAGSPLSIDRLHGILEEEPAFEVHLSSTSSVLLLLIITVLLLECHRSRCLPLYSAITRTTQPMVNMILRGFMFPDDCLETESSKLPISKFVNRILLLTIREIVGDRQISSNAR